MKIFKDHKTASQVEKGNVFSYSPLVHKDSSGGAGVMEGGTGLVIDAHQHFWEFDPVRDSWINDDMHVIQQDFMPLHLFPLLRENGVNGTVIVQSDQSEQENIFQLGNAEKFDFIKGVVGWVDLQDKDVDEKLAYYSGFEKMKGFRHVLQGEKDRALMLKPAFRHGIGLLKKYGFSYDILIFPDQLAYSLELVKEFPEQPFVIDHIAKPYIKAGKIDDWKKDMQQIARQQNVYCKISGMVTEADWRDWKKEDLLPYIDVVVTVFGTKRIMFGSDWPVCLVASSYKQWIGLLKEYFAPFSKEDKDAFFGNNATTFYTL